MLIMFYYVLLIPHYLYHNTASDSNKIPRFTLNHKMQPNDKYNDNL